MNCRSSLRVSLALVMFALLAVSLAGSGLIGSFGDRSAAQTGATTSDGPGQDLITTAFVINDVLVSEPISGTTVATFTVALTSAASQTTTVSYATANNTAVAPGDFVAVGSTVLTFTAGQTSKTVTVTVNSDALIEPQESFFVNLSNATGAPIVDSQGVGRIRQAVVDGDIGYGGSNISKVNGDGGSTTFLSFEPTFHAWSPDGSKVVYGSFFPRHIWTANADGTSQTDLTPTTQENYGPVSWSPDGTKIAFVSTRDGNEEIYTMNANGTSQTRLTNNGAFDNNPQWSPDGSKIAFTTTREGTEHIYIMNANGTSQTNISGTTTADFGHSWSPNGQKLVFSSGNGPIEIYTINADGSGRLQITNNSNNSCFSPLWSPTGDKIAFRNDGINRGYFVMNPDGTGITQVNSSDLNTFQQSFDWSPTGTRLAFEANLTSGFDSNPHIFVVNADGTNQKQLTSLFETDPKWQPMPAIGPLMSISNTSVVEGNSGTVQAIFTVTLSQVSLQTIKAVFNTLDQTATVSNNDYVSQSDFVTFAPGQTSQTISVTVNSDTFQEDDETLVLELTSITLGNARFLDRIGIATIVSDDRPSNDAFANAQLLTGTQGSVAGNNLGATREINEPSSNGNATVWYRWTAPATGSVAFRVHDGFSSCTNNQNLDVYTGTIVGNLTLIKTNGTGTSSLPQLVGYDAVAGTHYFIRVHGAQRPFTLSWSNAHKVTGTVRNINGRDIGGGTFVQNTSFCDGGLGSYGTPYTVYFPVGQSVVLRANLATQNPTIELRSSGVQDFVIFSPVFPISARIRNLPANTPGLTVNLLSSIGNRACTFQTTFPDGSLLYDCGNGSYQGDYRVKATLANYGFRPISDECSSDPGAYCIFGLPGAVSTTIDGLPALSVNDRTKAEGNSGTTTFDFTVTMPASTQQVTVTATTVDGTATTSNSDYIAINPPVQLTFLPGQTSKTVNVSVNGDTAFESDEAFTLRLENETNATVTKRDGTGTIQNDDAPPPVQITIQTSPAGRTVSIDGAPAVVAPQTVQWIPGSQHTIATTSPQSGAIGTQYVFTNWNDGNTQLSRTITTPAVATTYTATFNTQHQLTMVAGSGGTVLPSSGFRDSGAVVQITATPNSGFGFGGWAGTGAGSFTGTTNPATVTMNGPITQSASFVAASAIQFSSATVSGNEGAKKIDVIVSRGSGAGVASVSYATTDSSGTNGCNVVNGNASSRCDYLTTLGTLQFAAGETSKTISILLVDDVYLEGNESFNITLALPVGATLGTPASATLTIVDNDSPGSPNPIDSPNFFVRQHYLDFLNREPDDGGLAFWSNEITSCGSNAQCIEIKRINVSAAFFLSIEFQETGYLVYRFYKSGFGNLPGSPVPVRFLDFLKDTQDIGKGVQVGVGNWQALLEANKQSYAMAFVQRPGFTAAYPNSMTADQFVNQLNTNAGNVLSPAEKTNLVTMLGASPSDVAKRAQVLREVAEDQDLKNAEFNKAFVLMQYFGYMRRDPNAAPDANFDGFNFWLTKLNDFGGNFINAEMVKAFIISIEYRNRFAP